MKQCELLSYVYVADSLFVVMETRVEIQVFKGFLAFMDRGSFDPSELDFCLFFM